MLEDPAPLKLSINLLYPTEFEKDGENALSDEDCLI